MKPFVGDALQALYYSFIKDEKLTCHGETAQRYVITIISHKCPKMLTESTK